MKKSKHYTSNAFDFFKVVRSSKSNSPKDPNFKKRLQGYDALISSKYIAYDTAFVANNLTTLTISVFTSQEEADLLKMYSFRNPHIQSLKDLVLTDDEGRTHNTCLNCYMNEANTIDHFLPKGEYPQFAVHPKNLIPSCSNCNSKKSTNWRTGETSLFINAYLDNIPDDQFLFCNVIPTKTSFKVNFFIQNVSNINATTFALIESHFSRLKICKRLNKYSNTAITEIVNDYLPYRCGRLNDFITHVNKSMVHNINSFGINSWKNVLKSSLISSTVFQNYLKTK
jgi:hypothetical protein